MNNLTANLKYEMCIRDRQYPLLSDYDKKNEFDIEKYVKNRNRLRFKRNDVVDEVCDVGEITA